MLELCEILGTAQPALSHHLKILNNAGLVETRREGTSVYYRRALIREDDPLKELRACVFSATDEAELEEKLAQGIHQIHDNRHQQARTFFARNADRFQDDQDLIAHYSQYEECLNGVLENEQLATDSHVIEIGPGESDLILNLANRFRHILAVDNNHEMLEKTRAKTANTDLRNIDYCEGELHQSDEVSDLLVLNMVLHHIASPPRLFQDARVHLRPGGTLLIADLCSHDQTWTQDACGDLWLGFNTEEMDSWATAAGFDIGQSQYLGLKNGFQVLVKTYKSTPQGEKHD
ncbi:MAG: methyltransferase domain-containing protein [Pseudomonadales bacterium]|nr:methyltransferase domain-containing protein [Pseudomonadales bacterium]MBO6597974.1 methyltransferase domain-containing protein [Pseudomonadales bacterium]MBO6823004.1 methyltransferase domain-containing protein [Pseudomonadales bacterium]